MAFCQECYEKYDEKVSAKEQPNVHQQTYNKNSSKHADISCSKPRTCLNLDEKAEVIKYHEEHPGLGVRRIAQKFGRGLTQVSKIIKNKELILNEIQSVENQTIRKRKNAQKFSEINDYSWAWYNLCRESNVPVSGPMLQEEAKLMAERLGDSAFQGSNGWLEKWKRRYNIKEMRLAGEDGDVDETTLESWQERAKELSKGYAPEDVWNMDETAQFWKALPDKKRCRGGQKAKQRCTWAFFVNAAGGKEKPIVIGKAQNPRRFKHLKDKSQPHKCRYYANKKAWMKTEIMVKVLETLIT